MSVPRRWNSIGILLGSAAFLVACHGGTKREGLTTDQAHMYEHFEDAADVHKALVAGDMNAAKRGATSLATHERLSGAEAGSQGLLADMQRFAREVAMSESLAEAAVAASHLGRICGDCHTANRVDPRFLVGTAPPEGEGPKAEMARHVWASERMWEGMIGPLDHAWTSGAMALREGWLDPQEVVANEEDRIKVYQLVRQVYEIGTRAENTSEPSARAESTESSWAPASSATASPERYSGRPPSLPMIEPARESPDAPPSSSFDRKTVPMDDKPEAGSISWTDLTVEDAETIRHFYSQVVGWNPEPVDMGDYDDFNMCHPGSGQPAAGICHARGVNAELPPVWIPYIVVDDLSSSLAACAELGGAVLTGPKAMGPNSQYAVIRDPAGAVAGLYQTGE